jgi:ATP-dependent helicase HepA
MNDLIQIAAAELARFLGANLPALSEAWWQQHVVDRLSFQQQRMVQERGVTTLAQLDFAALLRVLDQNWYELSGKLALPNEGRNWVKELQTVRNKWAHLPVATMPPSEIYRDADTLGRLLRLIGAAPVSLAAVEATQAAALRELAAQTQRPADPATASRAPVAAPERKTIAPAPHPPLQCRRPGRAALQSRERHAGHRSVARRRRTPLPGVP